MTMAKSSMHKELSEYTVNRPTDQAGRDRMREQVVKCIQRRSREKHPTVYLYLPMRGESNFTEARSRNICNKKEHDKKMIDGCWFAVPWWRDKNHVSVRGYFFKKMEAKCE
ncbi:MAG: hypothetical protein GY938_13225 [Ketobacter sp.]|nr:hypothetical protein [Ketobacter sp.]